MVQYDIQHGVSVSIFVWKVTIIVYHPRVMNRQYNAPYFGVILETNKYKNQERTYRVCGVPSARKKFRHQDVSGWAKFPHLCRNELGLPTRPAAGSV